MKEWFIVVVFTKKHPVSSQSEICLFTHVPYAIKAFLQRYTCCHFLYINVLDVQMEYKKPAFVLARMAQQKHWFVLVRPLRFHRGLIAAWSTRVSYGYDTLPSSGVAPAEIPCIASSTVCSAMAGTSDSNPCKRNSTAR